jgi:hypothetical protein
MKISIFFIPMTFFILKPRSVQSVITDALFFTENDGQLQQKIMWCLKLPMLMFNVDPTLLFNNVVAQHHSSNLSQELTL